jgi:hypothetical protein
VNTWINLNALWKIVVVGLLTGAGLPALFAVGLPFSAGPGRDPAAGPPPDQAALTFSGVTAGWREAR